VDLNRNGRFDRGEPTAVTVTNGAYTLTGLAAGTYRVGVHPEVGWKVSTPGEEFHEVVVNGSTAAFADFGRVRQLIQPIADQQVDEGQAFSLPVKLTDSAAGRRLRYALESGAPAGASIHPVTGLLTVAPAGEAGRHTVAVRIRDAFDPLFTETVSFQLTVNNVAPRITGVRSAGPRLASNGEGIQYSAKAAFTDAGFLNTHRATIHWGDNTTPQRVRVTEANGTGSVLGSHVYAAPGVYTVTLTVTDSSGGSTTATTKIKVDGVWLDRGTLYGVGTAGNDLVSIVSQGSSLQVRSNSLYANQRAKTFRAREVDQIRLYLRGGHDTAAAHGDVTTPLLIQGGAGNDQLRGGRNGDRLWGGPGDDSLAGSGGDDQLWGDAGHDILDGGPGSNRLEGGAGNDLLRGSDADDALRGGQGHDILIGNGGADVLEGGAGRDILAGGLGTDWLYGHANDDLLISGSTAYDQDNHALHALALEWASGHDYLTRIRNLTDGSGSTGRGNGNYFLAGGETVYHDGVRNLLIGAEGSQWLFLDSSHDRSDRRRGEVLVDLDD
jgi:PKD repeat protein